MGGKRPRGSRERAPFYVQCEPKDCGEVAHQQLPSDFAISYDCTKQSRPADCTKQSRPDCTKQPQYTYDYLVARNMKDITDRFFMPPFPGYASEIQNNPDISFTSGLEMKFRLTDYWTSPVGSPLHSWARERNWLNSLGFETCFDHGAKQVNSSCGVVASRVATWLQHRGTDFIQLVTTGAASMEVLGQANMILHANDVRLNEPWIESSD